MQPECGFTLANWVWVCSYIGTFRFIPRDIPDLGPLEAPDGLAEEAGFRVCAGIWILVSTCVCRCVGSVLSIAVPVP